MNGQGIKGKVITAAIVALLVGGGVGYAIGMNMTDDSNNTASNTQTQVMEPTAPAADLRVDMNNLLREHVSTSLTVTRAIVDDVPQNELDGALASQAANGGDIAAAVGSVYGDEAQAQITELFVDHIEQSNNYARAVAAGDDTARDAAQRELDEYLNDIAGFFSGAISTLPQETVFTLLQEHEALLNRSVEAYQAGNFTEAYNLERQALTQISTVADALSAGIVETQPDTFNQ